MRDSSLLSISATSAPSAAQVALKDSEAATRPKSRQHCPIALVTGGSEHMTTEAAELLRGRLRLAASIVFVPFVCLLVLGLLNPQSRPEWMTTSTRIFQVVVTAIIGGIAALLWGRTAVSPCRLRELELVLFGSIGLFFGWIHFCTLAYPTFLDWAASGSGQAAQVLDVVLAGAALRWFALVVLYGVFIPNTAKRCAAIVGFFAVTPLIITAVVGLSDARLRPILPVPLTVQGVIMLAGASVAIFGSRRIYFLQEQANQARKLGQYRLVERLGVGGMGEVYLAEHVLLRRPCALKLIHADLAGDGTQISRFEREVNAMARLTHWNTVEVFDYGRTADGTFYYVMEYLPGQNLEALVNSNGPLPAARVVHLLRQVCGALREAHGLGILHRDIKPSNIIACERGGVHDVVKLLDFGLVHCLGGDKPAPSTKLTIQGTVLGSPPFMSPEQARGHNNLSSRSDIYSVGGVAYFLLTGQPPFVRDTVMEMLIAHASEGVAPPRKLRPDVPADLEAVVLRCLEKDPAKRFADVESLEKALAACAVAGQWSDETAAAWWSQNGETVKVQSSPSSAAAAAETTSLAVLRT